MREEEIPLLLAGMATAQAGNQRKNGEQAPGAE
jgi:hypothetical protein